MTEGWTVDPWGGVYDDRFIYGIGVSNMKAGDAASFCAVKTLLDAGVRLRGDVVLTYVIGELQGGRRHREGDRRGYTRRLLHQLGADRSRGPHAARRGLQLAGRADRAHASRLQARGGGGRHRRRDARLVPRLNALTFSGAASAEHASVNRAHVGVLRGALSRELHEWRPPQVADFVRLSGTARYAPSQSETSVLG